MSELLHYLSPQPASTPVYTKGNFFYRDGERFLIKGISYIPPPPPPLNAEQRPPPAQPLYIDPLADGHLGELKKDIPLLRDLGLNTISVGNLSPSNSHTAALQLLEQNGIYVLVNIFSSIKPPPDPIVRGRVQFDATSDPKPYYILPSALETFSLLDELAEHPNVLGFAVDAEVIVSPSLTPLATVFRACIRDSKEFLARRGKRAVPVGVATSQNQSFQHSMVQYFSAGESVSSSKATIQQNLDTPHIPGRADFIAYDNWAWAGKSNFQMSGWKNEVEMYERLTRAPMLLNAYGTNVSQPRVWDEVLCLYSPDMTGMFSGGFAYTFFEYGGRNYGLVKIDADGRRKTRNEFNSLRNKFRKVNVRFEDEVAVAERKNFEDWMGDFPELVQGATRWLAGKDLPEFPGSWEDVMQVVREQRPESTHES